MSELALATCLALAFLALLGVGGRLRFLATEIPSRRRRIAALGLLWAVLVACVFNPAVSPGDAVDVDPQTIWFPTLFVAHLVLSAFLVLWWFLAQPMSARRFLRIEHLSRADVSYGLKLGAVGWVAAIGASALVAVALLALGRTPTGGEESLAQPFDVPPLLLWLIHLPVWRKLIVVAVAMTVEEAFFRAFLQTRIGWLLSSVLFALSHGGYGLPTLTASVFAVSLVIGWALRRRGNLLPCIVAHGVFDGVQLLVVMPLAVEHLRNLA
jgi:membrane protease YdiL (CAAX protease family)